MKTDALQGFRSNDINCDKKVGKQRNVVVPQLGKVGIVDVRSKEGMSHVVTQRPHALDEIFNWLQEVESNEADAVVLPEQLLGSSSGCNDDLGPR